MEITRSLFTDPEHLLAHGDEDAPGWDEVHALIVRRLQIVKQGHLNISNEELGKYIPRADRPGEIGISGQQVGNLLRDPEKMNAEQVKKMCFLGGCSLAYLRGIVDSPTATEGHGDWLELYALMRCLYTENREILWKVGRALLEQQARSDMPEFYSTTRYELLVERLREGSVIPPGADSLVDGYRAFLEELEASAPEPDESWEYIDLENAGIED